MEVMELSDTENTKLAAWSNEPGVEEANKLSKTPIPTALGNEKIAILSHRLAEMDMPADGSHRARPGLELAISNVSNSTIATAMFEAVLYDQEGNIVDTIRHREIALEPDRSRGILIDFPPYYDEKVKSYDVRITRATTADVEKVQLRRHEARTTETGEEEIIGIVKNISQDKTDAAVVATFYDGKEENIGTKVVVLRDIEPNTIRQYHLTFKPQEGDKVETYILGVGEIAG